MVSHITQILTDLHTHLGPLNGFIGLAPTDAEFPLVTYTVLSSEESPSGSFTTEGMVATVQFSYFAQDSFLTCLDLAEQVEAVLDTLSDVLIVSEPNLTMVADTEKSRLYRVIDIRTVEVVTVKTPVS